MAVITRWSYKRGGRKAGFHCISNFLMLHVYYSRLSQFNFGSVESLKPLFALFQRFLVGFLLRTMKVFHCQIGFQCFVFLMEQS